MGLTRQEDIWACYDCGDLQGRHDLWFTGDICERCDHERRSITNIKEKIEAMYLDWLNNFLSAEALADYYEIDLIKALRVISIGRHINQRNHE
jgi:hypothetical protein